jgi:hypothetical protein
LDDVNNGSLRELLKAEIASDSEATPPYFKRLQRSEGGDGPLFYDNSVTRQRGHFGHDRREEVLELNSQHRGSSSYPLWAWQNGSSANQIPRLALFFGDHVSAILLERVRLRLADPLAEHFRSVSLERIFWSKSSIVESGHNNQSRAFTPMG